ncbi:MAG: lipid-binding SYLF domain-containing protein [Acidobacteriota bacterium]|nr:lipid-binding SYLF domain-containing protein [Acidobacteriota bacterium]
MDIRHTRLLIAGFALHLGAGLAVAQDDEIKRLKTATTVFEEIMEAPDNAIPRAIFDKATAVAIFPSTVKAGFIFGGHRGKGVISARNEQGEWSTPAFLTLTGGSFGLQIGGQSVDLILVIMNRRGLEKLLRNEFKIGGDASAVVGPLGRNLEASTDLTLRAEILSYSRTRGLFAGITLKGSTIRADRDANERFYDYPFGSGQLVLEGEAATPHDADAVANWRATLAKDRS